MLNNGRQVASLIVGTLLLLPIVGSPAGAAVIEGTDGPDVLTGTAAGDVIDGLAGDDTIRGRGGPDDLFGGADNDVIQGDAGSDRLSGGEGADELRGGYGPDEIETHGGDTVFGGSQDDFVYTSDNALPASVYGGYGDDQVVVAHRGSVARGGPGSDLLISREADTVIGGRGDDMIRLPVVCCHDDVEDRRGWARRIVAGPGNDSVYTAQAEPQRPISCGSGDDTIFISPGQTWQRDCETRWNYYFNYALCDGCDYNRFVGTEDNDWFEAGIGGDDVEARGGDDHIVLGDGGTALAGAGDDHVDADSPGYDDYPNTIRCGPGVDTVTADSNDDYSADCENVTLVD